MRIGRVVTEAVTQTKTVSLTCDLCGGDILSTLRTLYDQTEVKVEASIGDHFGTEGDSREHIRADICAECFTDRVVPALKAIGVTFHESSGEDPYWDKVEKS